MNYDDIAIYIGGLILAAGLFFVVDGVLSSPSSARQGKVIDRHYVPEQVSHGVISTGKTTTITTNYSPEEYLVVVESASGEIINVECDAKLYYSINNGQKIKYVDMLGMITGISYSKRGVNEY